MRFELEVDRRNITNEMLLNDIAAVAARLGTQSPTTDEYAKHGQFHPSTAIRRFRGWRAALTEAGLTPAHHNGGIDPETALADLRAVAARLGQTTVSNKQYLANGEFTDAPLLRAFGSWNAALKAAGLGQAKRAKIPTEELFENLERMWRALGRQPKYGEVAKPFSAFGAGTYESRFGSWRKALEAFVATIALNEPLRLFQSRPSPLPASPPVPARRTGRGISWRASDFSSCSATVSVVSSAGRRRPRGTSSPCRSITSFRGARVAKPSRESPDSLRNVQHRQGQPGGV